MTTHPRRHLLLRGARWRRLVLAVAVVLAAGCVSGSRTSVEVPLGRPAAPLRADTADADVLGTVATVLVERFGLPLSPPLRAHFYGSQDAFELGLVTDGGLEDRVMARDQARFASGVGTARGILIRADRVAAVPLVDRVGLYAHELTHVSQYEMAGGKRGGDQWLREGFADWVRYRTMEALGLRAYAESRRLVLRRVARAGSVERFPALGALVTNRQWTTARNELGGPATYDQAFLATDWLVERTGRERVVDYFRRFGRRDDRVAHFREAFGMPPGLFAEEFRAHLPTLLAGA
jgi:hypothetical protein